MDLTAERIPVELVSYDPEWAKAAEQESARLAAALGPALVAIHHVGSTAIPAIQAKPTIDLMPIVRTLEAADTCAPAVRALGYEWKGEFGLAGRRFCTLTDSQTGRRRFNVHIFEPGSEHAARLLAFRDFLRAHPEEARAYAEEKRRAASLHPGDTLAYNDAKDAWIKQCEARALAWASLIAVRPLP